MRTEDRGPRIEAGGRKPEGGTVRYAAPDFSGQRLAAAPAAQTIAAERDGVLPDGFFATTNLPTYVKGADGRWSLPREPRMDGCIIAAESGGWLVREGRRVRRGDRVVIGRAEDGSEGVLVHAHGFQPAAGAAGDFHFMSSQVSREKPIDYAQIARMLVDERARGGRVIWVTGPALVHSRARDNFVWFIRNGFVQALLAGNAVGAHDIESAVVGTTLGMTDSGEPTEGGHAAHMRAINAIRRAGSIANAVRDGIVQNGIMHACVVEGVPFVLCGSIRDDGPLPGVITDSIAAQGCHARAYDRRDDGRDDCHRAPLDRGRQYAAGVLRRPGARDR